MSIHLLIFGMTVKNWTGAHDKSIASIFASWQLCESAPCIMQTCFSKFVENVQDLSGGSRWPDDLALGSCWTLFLARLGTLTLPFLKKKKKKKKIGQKNQQKHPLGTWPWIGPQTFEYCSSTKCSLFGRKMTFGSPCFDCSFSGVESARKCWSGAAHLQLGKYKTDI